MWQEVNLKAVMEYHTQISFVRDINKERNYKVRDCEKNQHKIDRGKNKFVI